MSSSSSSSSSSPHPNRRGHASQASTSSSTFSTSTTTTTSSSLSSSDTTSSSLFWGRDSSPLVAASPASCPTSISTSPATPYSTYSCSASGRRSFDPAVAASVAGSPSSSSSPAPCSGSRRRANTGTSLSFTLDAVFQEPEEYATDEQAQSPDPTVNGAPATHSELAHRDAMGLVARGAVVGEGTVEEDHAAPVVDVDVNGGSAVDQSLSTRSRTANTGRGLSLSGFTLGRPKLERRDATIQVPGEAPAKLSFRYIKRKSKQLSRLQDRFAKSAPTTPIFTPSPSSDGLGSLLKSSRPSSIVVTGRPIECSSIYFSPTAHPSSPSSCNTSCYLPAMESLTVLSDVPLATEEPTGPPQPPNKFDSLLPREVKLKIFEMVVQNASSEHAAAVQGDQWSFKKAKENRWVGKSAGLREVVKLSRVSQEWRELAFDGQLWQRIHLSKTFGNESLPATGLLRLARHSGAFLRTLDLRGFKSLQSSDLDSLTDSCSAYAGTSNLDYVDLTGCVAISSKSLHYLIAHSPDIATLRIRGLPAVNISTCDTFIAGALTGLRSLDVSCCPNLLAAALLNIRGSKLVSLSAAKIPSMDSHTVKGLLEQLALLESLDIGYSRHVSDDAFKASQEDTSWTLKLKQLRLSGCSRLTDQTCINLADRVPELEVLEMATVGANLRDGGVIKLLETTPRLRKIDLEDAISLTDRTVAALLPSASRSRNQRSPTTAASALEHIVLTNIPELTETALIRLVRAAPKLRILEASNSFHVSDPLIKSFCHHVRKHRIVGAELDIVDCRNVGRQPFREQAAAIRPRRGFCLYDDRFFDYIESEPGARKGLYECDDKRIVVHSFWTWQQLDDVETAARSARTALLAIQGGAAPPADRRTTGSPGILRAARRASFHLRSDNSSSGGCIIS